MKKVTLLLFAMFSCCWLTHAQVNDPANWPNAGWTLTGTFDAGSVLADPTVSNNFSYDDDAAGSGSTDILIATSPVIDVTAGLGDGALVLDYDYNYNFGAFFVLEWFDFDSGVWQPWESIADNSADTSGWCGATTVFTGSTLDISGFTGTQLANFQYRFNYDASAVWGWGFCIDSPTLRSTPFVPPPANEDCAGALDYVAEFGAVGVAGSCDTLITTLDMTVYTDAGDDPTCDFGGDAAAWYTWVASTTSVTFTSGTGAPGLEILDGTCGTFTSLGCLNNVSGIIGGLTPGTTYYMIIWDDGEPGVVVDWCLEETPPPPANDDCGAAIALTVGGPEACTFTEYTNQSATASEVADPTIPAPGCAGYGGGDVWFTAVVPASGDLIVDTLQGVITDGGMAIYEGSCGALTLVECDDDDSDNGAMSRIDLTGRTPGETLYIRVWEFGNNNNGTFSICAFEPPLPPVNDTCGTALLVNGGIGGIFPFGDPGNVGDSFNNTSGTNSGPVGICESSPGGEIDVWYAGITVTSTAFTIEVTSGSAFNLSYSVYDACGGTLIACDDGLSSGPNLITGVTPGTPFWVQLWTEAGSTGAYTVVFSEPECLDATISSSTVVEDCGAGTFTVDVVVDDPGTATFITDGTNNYPISGAGTVTADNGGLGYPVGAPITLDVEYSGSPTSCDSSLGSFQDACPTLVDCTPGLVDGFCYVNNDEFSLGYAADTPGNSLNILFTAGTLEESVSSGNTFDDLFIYDGTDNTGTLLYDSNDGIVGNNDLTGLSFTASSGNLFIEFDADGSDDCGGGDQTPISYNITCVQCDPLVVDTITVNENCPGGTFTVDVTFSDLGTAGPGAFIFGDGTNGNNEFTPILPGVFTYTLTNLGAGFTNGLPVDFQVFLDSGGGGCDAASGFGPVQDTCPPANDTCATATVATVNAFGSCATDYNVDFTFASSSGPVGSCEGFVSSPAERDLWFEVTTGALGGFDIGVTAGDPADLSITVYDACGGTEIASTCDDALSAGLNTIGGLAPGTTYLVQLWTETFNDDIFTVCFSEPECITAEVGTPTINPLCDTAEYEILVDVTAVNSGTFITDGTTPQAAAVGTLTFGPYPTGTSVTLDVEHTATSCDFSLGSFLYDDCPTVLGCPGPTNFTYCYGNFDTNSFGYTSANGNQLKVTFNAGEIEAGFDELVILDSDGVTELFRGDNGGDLTALEFISSGDTIFVGIDSDSTFSCADGNCCSVSWDYDVVCQPCQSAVATTDIVATCDATDTFRVDIDVTDVGDAGFITDGANNYPISGAGVVSTVDYPIGVAVTLDVIHSNSSCDFTLGTFTLDACPPDNDDCGDAIALTVGNDVCNFATYTLEGATASEDGDPSIPDPTCANYQGGDVWFTAVVGATGDLTIDTNTGVTTDAGMSVYSGTCGTLVQIECDDDDSDNGLMSSIELTGRTPGETIYIRVWEFGGDNLGTFDICAFEPTPPPPPPANDVCAGALDYTTEFGGVGAAGSCDPLVTVLDITNYTDAGAIPDCEFGSDKTAWYTWTATAESITFTSGAGAPGLEVLDGTCGAFTSIACLNNTSGTVPGLTLGTTYYFIIWDDGLAGTSIDWCLEETPAPPTNDECATAEVVALGAPGICTTFNFDNTQATVSAEAAPCEATWNDPDLWYTFTLGALDTEVELEVTAGTSTSVGVTVYDACGGTPVFCTSSLPSGVNTISGLTGGATYWIQVFTETFSDGAYELCLGLPAACTPATISGETVVEDCVGGTFSIDFNVDLLEGATGVNDGTTTTPLLAGANSLTGYAVGTAITLTIEHADPACDFELGTFVDACPPANDDFANAIEIFCEDSVLGDTTNATEDESDAPSAATQEPDSPAQINSPNVWYSWIGTGQDVFFDTCFPETDYDTEILIFTGTSGNLTLIDDGYDECGFADGFKAQTGFTSVAGTVYYIAVDGFNGSNGSFRLDITCTGVVIDPPYVYNMGWSPGAPDGLDLDVDIIVEAGDVTIGGNTSCTSFTIQPGASATVTGTMNTDNGTTLNSTSTSYSSLILDGTLNGGVDYNRHVNINGSGTTGSNDLVSAPLTGQPFNFFAAANPNLFSNGSNTLFLFGPFNKTLGTFETYASTQTTPLTAGVGYRAATDDNGTLTFTGNVETGTITNDIQNTGPNNPEWNLVGNPYPSYMSNGAFLSANGALFDPPTFGIWGYDGSALNGWTLVNFANLALNPLSAPGQGFFVSADGTGINDSNDLTFTPAMRTSGSSDDYIVGRNAPLLYLKLKLSSANNSYGTDFFFNPASSLGFDLGYDAAAYGEGVPEFGIYSTLVEENNGEEIVLQSLHSTDLNDVTIPLGVNANQGEQITFSIDESTLPSTVQVYLDDTVANTTTLLNNSDYVITPTTDLSGTGRFFLRYSEESLSTDDTSLDKLDIFSLKASDELVVNGQLLENTRLELYDIQGRLVLQTELDSELIQNRIDVSNFNAGVYIALVQNDSQERTKKVIIE